MQNPKKKFTIQEVKALSNKGHSIKREDGSILGHCIRNPLDMGFKLEIYDSQELEGLIYEIKLTNPLEDEYLFSVKKDGEELGRLKRNVEKRLSPEIWHVMDEDDKLLCTFEQRSVKRSLLKRYVLGSIPINYDLISDDEEIGVLTKKFSFDISTYVLRYEDSLDVNELVLISVPLCIDNL